MNNNIIQNGKLPLRELPIMNVTIEDNSLFDGINMILATIRNNWDLKNISHKIFKDGYTNKLVACMQVCDNDKMSDVVLIRVYGNGSSMMIDRDQEFLTMSVLSHIGCSAPPYARFKNGIAYGYCQGIVLTNELVMKPVIQRLVIKELVRMHTTDVNNLLLNLGFENKFSRTPYLFPTLKKWLSLIPQKLEETKLKSFKELNWTRDEIEDEINLLEKELTKLNSPIVFCHNDLLLKNVIYNEHNQSVAFIDFEYAAYNYQAFDIANHFCEYAGMDVIDFSLYPSKAYQLQWLKLFNAAYVEIAGNHNVHVDADAQVECLYVQVNKFALAAHIFWALWAIIQSIHSKIDYNYLHFAKSKLEEYKKRKSEFLSLVMPTLS